MLTWRFCRKAPHKTGPGSQATSRLPLHLLKIPHFQSQPSLVEGNFKGGNLRWGREARRETDDPPKKAEGSVHHTVSPSNSTVRLLLLKLPGQYLIRRQKSHSHVEEDLPDVPQPVQVHVAQADKEQQQQHLQSPGPTVEQVQVTLQRHQDRQSDQRGGKGRGSDARFTPCTRTHVSLLTRIPYSAAWKRWVRLLPITGWKRRFRREKRSEIDVTGGMRTRHLTRVRNTDRTAPAVGCGGRNTGKGQKARPKHPNKADRPPTGFFLQGSHDRQERSHAFIICFSWVTTLSGTNVP